MIRSYALVLLTCFIALNTSAQSWSIGGGPIYGDDIKNMGLNLRSYYNFANNKICFGPEYSYFLAKTEISNGATITRKLSEINFNIHYIFELSKKWGVYPLVGVNISVEKEEVEVGSESEVGKMTNLGGNLGFGIHRPFGKWVIFAEFDHLFNEFPQNSVMVGVFITLGEKTPGGENE